MSVHHVKCQKMEVILEKLLKQITSSPVWIVLLALILFIGIGILKAGKVIHKKLLFVDGQF